MSLKFVSQNKQIEPLDNEILGIYKNLIKEVFVSPP